MAGINAAENNPQAQPLTLKIVFTAYDRGGPMRTLVPGVDGIKVEADLSFIRGDGGIAGRYRISKVYSLADQRYVVTDVEMGFRQSVVDLIRDAR